MAVFSLAIKPKEGAPDDVLTGALARWEDEGGRLEPEATSRFALTEDEEPVVQRRAATGKRSNGVVL